VTSQASLHAQFVRAVERGNVLVAEACARDLPNLALDDALRLVFLYADRAPQKFERAAVRWLGRYVAEGRGVTLLKAHVAVAALADRTEPARVLLARLC
jgi:hypothetical protein